MFLHCTYILKIPAAVTNSCNYTADSSLTL